MIRKHVLSKLVTEKGKASLRGGLAGNLGLDFLSRQKDSVEVTDCLYLSTALRAQPTKHSHVNDKPNCCFCCAQTTDTRHAATDASNLRISTHFRQWQACFGTEHNKLDFCIYGCGVFRMSNACFLPTTTTIMLRRMHLHRIKSTAKQLH
jgi:hypothetical protein